MAEPYLIQQSFSVQFSYPVYFVVGVFSQARGVLASVLKGERSRRDDNVEPVCALAVIDDGVVQHHPDLLEQVRTAGSGKDGWRLVGEPLVLPGGERSKNDPAVLDQLCFEIEARRLDRHSYILAVGGGALLDAVGFAAAIAHRGVRLVRIPTTVLSQNDSGVGVKNGVNRFGSKNYLGTFAPPYAVINDKSFLSTLSCRDFASGMAEAIKVSLIKDEEFFAWLEESALGLVARQSRAVEHMVRRTAELHLDHIRKGGDAFESGSKRPLDFGHWAAHKLEVLSEHRLRHGEAVAIGIALDVVYSMIEHGLAQADCDRVLRMIETLGLPTYDPTLDLKQMSGEPAYLAGLEEFRQHLGGRLNVTMLSDLGKGIQVHRIDNAIMERGRGILKRRRSQDGTARVEPKEHGEPSLVSS